MTSHQKEQGRQRKPCRPSPTENIFLLLGTCYGILFCLITPPFQAPDEPNHFFRAYQISEGRLVPEMWRDGVGGTLPVSVIEIGLAEPFQRLPSHPERKIGTGEILRSIDLSLEPAKRVFAHFPNTSLYPPLPYGPQSLGIMAGRLLHLSPLALMYGGRIANLLVWVLLMYLAIRIMPMQKSFFLLLALMPMSVFQAASLSIDAFTNSAAFLLIALVMRSAVGERDQAGFFGILSLTVLTVLVSLSKPGYFLLALLAFMLPFRSGGGRRYLALAGFLISLSVAAAVFWALFMDGIQKEIFAVYGAQLAAMSPEKQIAFIVGHPLEYTRILLDTFAQQGRSYLDQFIGQLGWQDVVLPGFLRTGYVLVLFFAALADTGAKNGISLSQRSVALVTFVASVVVVLTIAYIGWNKVGAGTIGGIQGRYFIPIAPLLFLPFHNRTIRLGGYGFNVFLICFLVFSLTYTGWALLQRYYF